MTRRSVFKQKGLFLEEIFSSNMSKGQVENMVKAADLDGHGELDIYVCCVKLAIISVFLDIVSQYVLSMLYWLEMLPQDS